MSFTQWREGEMERVNSIKERLERDGIKVDWDIHNDHTIKRFLRARGQDEELAYVAFTNCLKWREENNVDRILETKREANPFYDLLKAYWPGEMHGKDKDGDPIYIERLGDLDVKGLLALVPPEKLVHYNIVRQEERRLLFKQESARQNREVEQLSIIQDMSNMGWKSAYPPALDICKQVISMADQYYPECLKRYYVINPPKALPLLYKVITPFVDPATLKKVIIAQKPGVLPAELLAQIDIAEIPEVSGGKCDGNSCQAAGTKRGDGLCMPRGGPLKDSLIRPNGTTYIPVSINIPRKSKHEVVIKAKAGDKLRWDYQLPKYDLASTLKCKNEDGSFTRLISTSSGQKVEESFEIPKKGTYILEWDNASARKKDITFNIALIKSKSNSNHVISSPALA